MRDEVLTRGPMERECEVRRCSAMVGRSDIRNPAPGGEAPLSKEIGSTGDARNAGSAHAASEMSASTTGTEANDRGPATADSTFSLVGSERPDQDCSDDALFSENRGGALSSGRCATPALRRRTSDSPVTEREGFRMASEARVPALAALGPAAGGGVTGTTAPL